LQKKAAKVIINHHHGTLRGEQPDLDTNLQDKTNMYRNKVSGNRDGPILGILEAGAGKKLSGSNIERHAKLVECVSSHVLPSIRLKPSIRNILTLKRFTTSS